MSMMPAGILIEAKKPNPENFVPVFDFSSKVVWVWVKNPGGKVVGPVEVPHKNVNKYAGKLGWPATKIEYVGQIDPTTYSSWKTDIFNPNWKSEKDPGDEDPIVGVYAPPVVAEPKKKKPKGASKAFLQGLASLSEPEHPKEFTLTGKKDPNGHPTVINSETDETFTVLPSGGYGKWEDEEGVYYIAKKSKEGWSIHLDSPVYAPEDVVLKKEPEAAKEKTPEEFELPPNYSVSKVDPDYVMAKTPDGTEVQWIKILNMWVHADNPTKEHDPLEAAHTPEKAPEPETKKGQPSTKKPPQKAVVASEPEEEPALLKYTGHVDPNGFPLVNEYDEVDEDEIVNIELTLLPDDRAARWRSSYGDYLLYEYDPHEGYIFSLSGETMLPEDVKALMKKLSLTVKNGKYHKVSYAGAEKPETPSYQVPLPGHCKLIGKKDANGLQMVETVPEDEEDEDVKILSLLPDSRLGEWDEQTKKYQIWSWFAIMGFYDYYPTQPSVFVGLKEVQKLIAQVPAPAPTPEQVPPPPPSMPYGDSKKKWSSKEFKALQFLMSHTPHLKGYDVQPYSDPNGMVWLKDKHDGANRTLLPTLAVAVWNGTTYEAVSPDNYGLVHKGDLFTVEQAKALKGKVEALKKKAGEQGLLKPTGETDPNGYPIGEYKSGTYTMLPDNQVGIWLNDKGLYSIYELDPEDGYYHPTSKEWLVPGKHASVATANISGLDLAQVKDSDGNVAIVLPHGLFVAPTLTGPHAGQFVLQAVDPKTKLFTPTDKAVSPQQIKAALGDADFDDMAYKSLKPTGEVDINGLPTYKVVKGADAGKNFSLLPDGWFASWRPKKNAYVKFQFVSLSPEYDDYWEPTDKWVQLSDLDAMYLKQSEVSILGGEEGAEEEEPEEVPEPIPEKPAPVSELSKALEGKLPDVSKLKYLGPGSKFGLGGAGKKDIYEDKSTKKRYIFKPAYVKGSKKVEEFRAHAQEAASALALAIRPEHVPVKMVTLKGVVGTLQPWVDLDPSKGTLEDVSPKSLTDQQKKDVATDHLMDWALSQHDSYDGNMVYSADGHILSIDKEQGFKFFGKDELSSTYNPNPIEPFYNKFWRDFADNKMDFDPKVMKDALDKIREINPQDYVNMVRPYAETYFKGDKKAQRQFLRKVLSRKLHLEADFEEFITGLYKKRTKQGGKFTFDKGWLPTDAPAEPGEEEEEEKLVFTGKKSVNLVTGSGNAIPTEEFLKHLKFKWGIKKYHAHNPDTGAEDPSYPYVTLKVEITQADQLKRFLKKAGLKPQPILKDGATELTGQYYYMTPVKKSDWENLVFEDTPYVTPLGGSYGSYDPTTAEFPQQPDQPKHFGTTVEFEPPEAKPNVQILNKKAEQLAEDPKVKQVNGTVIGFDGGDVEGANGRLRKYKDAKGFYLQKQFKMRREQWEDVNKALEEQPSDERKWKPESFKFYTGPYSKKSGAVELGTTMVHSSAEFNAFKFSFKEGDLYIARIGSGTAKSFTPYSFVASVVAQIRDMSVDALATLKKWLNKVMDGLGDKLFKPPTKAEIERKKLFRLAWVFGGNKAHSLKANNTTKIVRSKAEAYLQEQSKYMKDGGYTLDEALALMEEQEVLPGYSTHVLPGRWRKLAQGKVWFVHQGFDLAVIPSIARSGLLGIHMRNQLGVYSPSKGSSFGTDTNTGAGDQTLCRLATSQYASKSPEAINLYGECIAVVHPEVADRLDTYFYNGDKYGKCCPTATEWKHIQPLEEKIHSTYLDVNNEIMFRQGIDVRKILRIVVKNGEPYRQKALKICQNANVTEVNGIPVAEFIVTASNGQEIWDKYVKPIAGI